MDGLRPLAKGAETFQKIENSLKLYFKSRYISASEAFSVVDSSISHAYTPQSAATIDCVFELDGDDLSSRAIERHLKEQFDRDSGEGCAISLENRKNTPSGEYTFVVCMILIGRIKMFNKGMEETKESMSVGGEHSNILYDCLGYEDKEGELSSFRVFNESQIIPLYVVKAVIHRTEYKRIPCQLCKDKDGILYCKQDSVYLCKECDEIVHGANEIAAAHVRVEKDEVEEPQDHFEDDSIVTCEEHHQHVTYYCYYCQSYLCDQCTEVHAKNTRILHKLETVRSAYHDAINEATRNSRYMENVFDALKSAEKSLQETEEKVHNGYEAIRANIDGQFTLLYEELEHDYASKCIAITSAVGELKRQRQYFEELVGFWERETKICTDLLTNTEEGYQPRQTHMRFLKRWLVNKSEFENKLMNSTIPSIKCTTWSCIGSLKLRGRGFIYGVKNLNAVTPQESPFISQQENQAMPDQGIQEIQPPELPKRKGDAKHGKDVREFAKKLQGYSSAGVSEAEKSKKGQRDRAKQLDQNSDLLLVKYLRMQELIIRSDLEVVKVLIEISLTTASDTLAACLFSVFEGNGLLVRLMKYAINEEVQRTITPATIFRTTTPATKIVTRFQKRLGQKYLADALSATLKNLLANPVSFEIDPLRIPPTETKKINLRNLQSFSLQILQGILSLEAPLLFKKVVKLIHHYTIQKYPESGHNSIAIFVFLRFFCVAIVSPEEFDLIRGKIDKNMRRNLLLASKVLQNLSTGILFGMKEDYMMELNPFLQKHTGDVEQFLIAFTKIDLPDDEISSDERSVTSLQVVAHSLQEIHRTLSLQKDDLLDDLIKHGGPHVNTISELKEVLKQLGPPTGRPMRVV